MTDLELLVLAAKAAGLTHADYADVGYDGRSGLMLTDEMGRQTVSWSPLTDDGDALRLAVMFPSWVNINTIILNSRQECAEQDDQAAYVRRAIVRAAADIGREE